MGGGLSKPVEGLINQRLTSPEQEGILLADCLWTLHLFPELQTTGLSYQILDSQSFLNCMSKFLNMNFYLSIYQSSIYTQTCPIGSDSLENPNIDKAIQNAIKLIFTKEIMYLNIAEMTNY
jgi:hypothetical protein